MAGRRIIALFLAGIMLAGLSLPRPGYADVPASLQVTLALEDKNQGQPDLAEVQRVVKEIQARFEAMGMPKPALEQRGGRLIRITLTDADNTHQLEEVLGILAFEFKERYPGETVFTGSDIAEVMPEIDPVSGQPAVKVRFQTDHAGAAGLQKKSLAAYVTDYSPIAQPLKLVEPGRYTIEGFRDLAEACKVAALLYNASHPLDVKILDSVRQTGGAGSSTAAATAAVASKHPFLSGADKYAAFYNPFRCQELLDLCSLVNSSQGGKSKTTSASPAARQKNDLMGRVRSYVMGDDIRVALSGSKILSLVKGDAAGAAMSSRGSTARALENQSSLMHIGYSQENRVEEYLSYYAAGAMASKLQQAFEYNNRQVNIMMDYCYYDQKQGTAYIGAVFCNAQNGLAWSPAQGQMGKTIVFRIHNPQLTAVTAENLHQFDDFVAKRYPGASPGDNNIREKLMKHTNSSFLLPSGSTGLFGSRQYIFYFPVDVGDFSLEQALAENGFPADSVVFVDLP